MAYVIWSIPLFWGWIIYYKKNIIFGLPIANIPNEVCEFCQKEKNVKFRIYVILISTNFLNQITGILNKC